MSERRPTPEQEAIIAFIRENPEVNLMVDARAGAAKTSTIEMAAPQIKVDSTLAVAFNKRIAEELSTRLPSGFHCKTLNGVGHGAWQNARGKRQVVDPDKMFKLAKEVIPPESQKEEDLFATVLALARRAKSVGLVPAGAPMGKSGLVPDHHEEWEEMAFTLGLFDVSDDSIFFARKLLLKSISEAFQSRIDFDDQIYMSVLFGGVFPLYHTVIVDESQDLSPLNHRQLMRLTRTRLISVGDPYQAIYAFRGADGKSMTNLEEYMQAPKEAGGIGRGKFKRLGLTQSFRVPKAISKRQLDWVPDFGSMPHLPEGQVVPWPIPKEPPPYRLDERSAGIYMDGPANLDRPIEQERLDSWSVLDIPRTGAVLCRNNAPLMKLAFALIKKRVPVRVLGRDIGGSLANLLLKITGKESSVPTSECYLLVEEWRRKEVAKVPDSEAKQETIHDRAESLLVLLEAYEDGSRLPNNQGCANFIRDLFSDSPDNKSVTLASGHRSKGLEWEWVMHLDPWRVPSKQAKKAADRGDERPMIQEMNLKYVIETRAKHTLVLANLEDCVDVGGE